MFRQQIGSVHPIALGLLFRLRTHTHTRHRNGALLAVLAFIGPLWTSRQRAVCLRCSEDISGQCTRP